MFKINPSHSLAPALLSLCAFSFVSLPANANNTPRVVPDPPSLSAKGYVLLDFHSGKVLVEKNANQRLNPASLTKLMTSYVAGREMNNGNISSEDVVVISENAWAKNFPDSSKMFIEVNSEVKLMDLYRGLIIQSGNDASVAIAEHVAGSESAFVSLMNAWAGKLNLTNTAFSNPHGLDSDSLYSTPYDIALLGQAIIRDLPDIYPLYSERSFTYNRITQNNRNGLLRDRSIAVDGMKTGYTSGAGYSLASSATQGEMRLIAVVMGAKSTRTRESESKQLLSYGFRFFETVSPHKKGETVITERVWMGTDNNIDLGTGKDSYITLSKSSIKDLKANVELNGPLTAPIQKGDVVGKIIYQVDGEEVGQEPLVALKAVEEGNWFSRLFDHIKLFFTSLFSSIF